MSKVVNVDETQHIWGTFDLVKGHLYDQFQNVQYDPDTGLSLKDIEHEVETYLQNHPDHLKVLQKANIFRTVRKELVKKVKKLFRHQCQVK